MKNVNVKTNVLKLTLMAMLIAISIASLYLIRFPIIPSAAFLEYDIADVPILIGAMMFGPVAGLATLFITCLIQALTVSASSGWVGFVMHFCASGALVLISSLIYRKTGKSLKGLIIGLVLGALAMIALMIPLNLVFIPILFKTDISVVKSMLLPAIIPFNAIKAGANAAITAIVFLPLRKIIKSVYKDEEPCAHKEEDVCVDNGEEKD